MLRRLQLLKTTWELSGLSPISFSVVASCVRLQLRPLLSTGATSFLGTTSLVYNICSQALTCNSTWITLTRKVSPGLASTVDASQIAKQHPARAGSGP